MSDHQKPEWFAAHEIEDRAAFALRPTKEEMKEIVHDALVEFFTVKGKLTKNIIVTVAILIGAFAVIFGGFKWIFGIFGYIITRQ